LELSELELVEAWRNGDDWAFEQLYKKHVPTLLKHAMLKINDRESSEELVQDTFMIFYKQRSQSTTIQSVPAYLHTILKNKVLDHYRHEKVLQRYKIFAAGAKGQESYEETSLEAKELNNILSLNIEKLPKQCKKVFKLSREEQLSNREIARQLNISENTVEQHMRKALRLLRRSITINKFFILLIMIISNRLY